MSERGEVFLVVSDLLLEELSRAPHAVQAVLAGLPPSSLERIAVSDESIRLRDAYLAAKVVGASSLADAHDVALATLARADLIVSWKFKQIIHIQKIRGFHAVNLLNGYPTIDVRSPLEVVP